ncbi:MAG: hypothetical protein ACLFV3_07015 [Phycisphaeraceae bacterium]
MLLGKIIAVWFAIMVAEVIHGVLRGLLLEPRVGEAWANRVGIVTGSGIVFAVAWFGVPWTGAQGTGELLLAGAVWVALTLAFEVVFGRWVLGYPWSRIAADYDFRRGGLMPLGLLVMLLSPLIVAALRG